MTVFITSSPFREDVDRPTFSNANGFVDNIRACLPSFPRCLYICSSPDRRDLNARFGADIFMAFANAGIHFSGYHVLDGENPEEAEQLVSGCDLIVLAGGHVPTQNAFFQRIDLRRLLRSFNGVVMGISAGSMNCADTVYAQPEEPGESAPEFARFIPGLGLTDVNILPHYQKVKNDILDGKRLFEDITYADSAGHTFFVLPDFSYVTDGDDGPVLWGEGCRLKDGVMELLSRNGEHISLAHLI